LSNDISPKTTLEKQQILLEQKQRLIGIAPFAQYEAKVYL
jgi:hypothetical protein